MASMSGSDKSRTSGKIRAVRVATRCLSSLKFACFGAQEPAGCETVLSDNAASSAPGEKAPLLTDSQEFMNQGRRLKRHRRPSCCIFNPCYSSIDDVSGVHCGRERHPVFITPKASWQSLDDLQSMLRGRARSIRYAAYDWENLE